MLFQKGHKINLGRRGFKHTKETREKMSQAALERDNTNQIASMPKGNKHWNWSENSSKISRVALHKRLYRKFGSASKFNCVDCVKKAQDWSNENEKYTDNRKDYKPRCRSCHMKYDFKRKKVYGKR